MLKIRRCENLLGMFRSDVPNKFTNFYFFIILIVFVQKKVIAIENNYFDYHNKINNAEQLYFIDRKCDSALNLYRETFSEYEFVFAKDCLIAAQLALINRKKLDLFFFLQKAFENGVMLQSLKSLKYVNNDVDLQRVEVFDPVLNDVMLYDSLRNIFLIARKKYLARLNKTVLSQLNYTYVNDQLNKNIRIAIGENEKNRKNLYASIINSHFILVDSIIRNIGIPLEKIAGLSQKGINSELELPNPDLTEIFDTISATERIRLNVVDDMFKYDPNAYNCSVSFTQMIHYPPFFFKYRDIFLDQIKKGNIHPREVAVLFDFWSSFGPAVYKRAADYSHEYFNFVVPIYDGTSYEVMSVRNIEYSDSKIQIINKMRNNLYLSKYEVDIAKRNFEKMNKIKVSSFGFFMSL